MGFELGGVMFWVVWFCLGVVFFGGWFCLSLDLFSAELTSVLSDVSSLSLGISLLRACSSVLTKFAIISLRSVFVMDSTVSLSWLVCAVVVCTGVFWV